MAAIRKPFQGTLNIVRFNWHFYVLSGLVLAGLFLAAYFGAIIYTWAALFIAVVSLVSLLVSVYVYDLSGFYKLGWLNNIDGKVININAGFDEISELLAGKYSNFSLSVFDFYNPKLHTEISIKRARKIYPPYPGTLAINIASIPFANNSVDKILVIFAAHEIRSDVEKMSFFSELFRILKPGGEVIVVEHLRDLPNFLAYNLGFLHFAPQKAWYKAFNSADFKIKESKINPFVSKFSLTKSGD